MEVAKGRIKHQIIVRQHEQQRVELKQIEPSAGGHQVGHHVSPGIDIVEPVQRPEAGVDHVIGLTENLRRIVDIRLNEGGLEAALRRELRSGFDRCTGEVQSGDRRSSSSP